MGDIAVETVDGRVHAAQLITQLWLDRRSDKLEVLAVQNTTRTERLRLAQVDTEKRAGTPVGLTHKHYEASSRGRQWIVGSRCVFEEDGAACRVEVELPSQKSAQIFNATLETKLYNAVRAKRVHEQKKRRDAERKEAVRRNTPRSVGRLCR